jgi:allantoicase
LSANTELFDLLTERLGGAALLANDEFFAAKENLVKPDAPVFREHEYTDRGKWMDGWETRRKRVPGHDWCILRLALPGIIRRVVVDTAFFKGNFPESCSLEACALPPNAAPDDVASSSVEWIEIVPRSLLAGDSKNPFDVRMPWCFTHVRLNIHPDGGVARLRILGEPHPDWHRIAAASGEIDLAAIENGGAVLATSDRFFSSPHNLLVPGRGTYMGDGWETRRRRGPGHDWALIRLGLAGPIARAVIETTHFKGNYPDSCSIEACDARAFDESKLATPGAPQPDWRELLPRQSLHAHASHEFVAELAQLPEATHVRFNMHPDGGVSRLRLYGTLSPAGRTRAGMRWLDALTPSQAERELLACCGTQRLARSLVSARPFHDLSPLLARTEQLAHELTREDWLESFARHPRIGERAAGADRHARWSTEEQSSAKSASDADRSALLEANRGYESRFGWNFIVCATGKSLPDILAILKSRLTNSPDAELRVASNEQLAIARLRLEKLVGAR